MRRLSGDRGSPFTLVIASRIARTSLNWLDDQSYWCQGRRGVNRRSRSRRRAGAARTRAAGPAAGRFGVCARLAETTLHRRPNARCRGDIHGAARHEVRHLPRPVPQRRREPHARDEPRHGADRVAGPPRLRRGVDRRAPLRGLGADRLARGLHRRRRRAHAPHHAGLRGHEPPLPPPADGRPALRAARPHDARPRHARHRPRRSRLRRLHDGHRAGDPARPHGRVARRDHAAPPVRRSRSR